MELMRLGDAPRCVGRTDVKLAAVVQQISRGRRAVVGGKQRVCTYHVLHLADASKTFFKMTCWGDDLPALSLQEHAPQDALLRVGDIALFTDIQIKAHRGNVEAQFARQSSRVQLLYRRDRYFNTRDVRLTDFYPMIEWYKQHRHEFFLASDRDSSGGSQSHDSSASGAALSSPGTGARTKIRDLRENMVANVLCKVRKLTPSESVAMGAHLVHQSSNPKRVNIETTDFDGVLLHELVMQDSAKDWMVVNLWDQHAESKFVARLLAHPGLVEIKGIVLSLNGLSNRLLANTTPQTQISFVDPAAVAGDRDAQEVWKSLDFDSRASVRLQTVCASLDELENSSSDGLVLVDNVRVERMDLGKLLGSASRVEPPFAQLLVESYCSVCNDVLPERELDAIPPLYGPCKKRCRARSGEKERLWRYRRFQMVIRDAHQQRLELQVESDALLELLGSIDAEMLIHPHIEGNPPPFSVNSAVAALLNALVGDGAQTFRAEIRCSRSASQGGEDSQHSHSAGLSEDTPQQQSQQRTKFTLASLVASPSQHLVI